MIFLTPVFFVADDIHNRLLHRVIMLNPLTYLVEFPRSVLLSQPSGFASLYLAAAVASFLIFLIGIKVFDLVQDLVAERL